MFVVLPLRISATQRLPDTRPAKGRVSFVQTVDTTQSVTLEVLAEDWQRSLTARTCRPRRSRRTWKPCPRRRHSTRGLTGSMADLLIFLEEWEWARQGMIEELSRA
jgi:hypothetical protein